MRKLILFTLILFSGLISAQNFDFECHEDTVITNAGLYNVSGIERPFIPSFQTNIDTRAYDFDDTNPLNNFIRVNFTGSRPLTIISWEGFYANGLSLSSTVTPAQIDRSEGIVDNHFDIGISRGNKTGVWAFGFVLLDDIGGRYETYFLVRF